MLEQTNESCVTGCIMRKYLELGDHYKYTACLRQRGTATLGLQRASLGMNTEDVLPNTLGKLKGASEALFGLSEPTLAKWHIPAGGTPNTACHDTQLQHMVM